MYEAFPCAKLCAKTWSVTEQAYRLWLETPVRVGEVQVVISSPHFSPELGIHRAKTTLSIPPGCLMPSNRHLIGICPDPDSKPTPPTTLSISIEAPPFFLLLQFLLESSML